MNPQKITQSQIQKIYKPAEPKTHKGIQGHALIIGGSYGKIGSVCLAGKAALRSGCGLVTVYLPECGYNIIQSTVPEAMAVTDGKKHLGKIKFRIAPKAIGIGPGMGQSDETQMAFRKFLKSNAIPLVIDADGLNILSENEDWLELLQPGRGAAKTILTPHYKELERLLDGWNSDEEMLQKTIALSKQHNVIIVVKGAPTQIIDGDDIYENTSGNAALATAGSGDVLTGIITGLLAQSYDPLHAALLGVYLHGTTADIALPHSGTESFIASDIIHLLGKAFLSIGGNRNEIGFK